MTPSFVIATLALVLAAISGVATAAPLITGRDIAKNAVTTKHIKDKTVQAADLAPKTRTALRGPAGTPGRDGVSGYEVVSGDSSPSETSNDWIHVTVNCPIGKVPLGAAVDWIYAGEDAYGPGVLFESPSTASLTQDGTGYIFRGSPISPEFVLRGKVTCATIG